MSAEPLIVNQQSPIGPSALGVSEIIKRCGGAVRIEGESAGSISAEAVYKWPKIGIPDRHWPLIIRLSGVTADELLAANVAARSAKTEQSH